MRSKSNLNIIAELANSGVLVSKRSQRLAARSTAEAGLVTISGILAPTGLVAFPVPGLCSRPLVSGSFTKHFRRSFSLSFNIRYWCPTYRRPFSTCTKRVTLASLSFSVDVSVGYRITCCDAVAWGQASGNVCGSILRFRRSAGCTAQITGLAGFGRTGSGSHCVYGLGVNAQLRCTFGGRTILNLQATFGWNINGPYPPCRLC